MRPYREYIDRIPNSVRAIAMASLGVVINNANMASGSVNPDNAPLPGTAGLVEAFQLEVVSNSIGMVHTRVEL